MNLRTFISLSEQLGYTRRQAAVQLAFLLGATFLEGVGLAILLPVFQFVQSNGDLAALTAQGRHWTVILDAFAVIGIEVSLASLLIISLSCIMLRQVFVYARMRFTTSLVERLSAENCHRGFERFMLARASHHDSVSLGTVVNDLTIELRRAIGACSAAVQHVGFVLLIAFYAVLLFALSPSMTMAAVAVFAVVVVLLRRIARQSVATGKRVTQANQRMSEFLIERMRTVRLIRLSGTERPESARMGVLTGDQRRHMTELLMLVARMDVLTEPIVVAVGFGLLYVGITYFQVGIGEIGLFLVIVMRLLPVLKEAMRARQTAMSSQASLLAVTSRLSEMEAAAECPGGAKEFDALRQGIRFDAVTFSYSGASGQTALKNLSLDIPRGSLVALVGPSGAGKSTLIDMLPRVRIPDQGQVLFDGTPITDFSLSSLRAGIAYAPQQPQIFNVTPVEHIRYGRPDASMEDIVRAAELAGIAPFIETLPQGWDTLLGEGGGQLSGGQRQRLDLARALVKGAPILILDEPTSSLDSEAEQWFRATLARIHAAAGTTIFLVAHRLSMVTFADRIVVMMGGQVAATGTHDQLLAAGGWYADACRNQSTSSLALTDTTP